MNPSDKTGVLVIGAGLSGLHTAWELHQKNISFLLVEARNRNGGRILSNNLDQTSYDSTLPGFDLGPAWFWQHQHRLLALIKKLDLQDQVFTQFCDGAMVYEDRNGEVQHGAGVAGMAGSLRLRGGIRQLIARMANDLPESRVLNGTTVTQLALEEHVVATLQSAEGDSTVTCERVVLAMPPRIALSKIKLVPAFDKGRISKLNDVATWMAGQAKFVALYDAPFWRMAGLSGDAMSQHGPMHEIHDASPPTGGPYGLFGFVGVPVGMRKDNSALLKQAAIEQLVRLFGDQAKRPLSVYYKDWALDDLTSVVSDRAPLRHHPVNDSGETVEPGWNQRLLWSGTETASMREYNNGYLEGALESSERTLAFLQSVKFSS